MDAEAKSKRAQAILNDEVYREAMDVVTSYHIGVFTNPNSSQEEIMEAHRMVRALALIEGQLGTFADDAKFQKRRTERMSRG